MSDLPAVIEAWEHAVPGDRKLALATVVRTEGSTYRRPGARMLVFQDRRQVGSVSGGCLENDVVEHALRVIETGKPKFVLYEMTGHADAIFETGCPGTTGILIESAASRNAESTFQRLADCSRRRKSAVMVTVFGVNDLSAVHIGDRLFYVDGVVTTDIANRAAVDAVIPYVCDATGSTRARSVSTEIFGGSLDLLIEPMLPPVALVICGAGHDAAPVTEMAARLGWQVTVADHRLGMLTCKRFPSAMSLIETWPDKLLESVTVDSRTAAVVMTHNYQHDLAYVRALLSCPAPYVGMLGPRRRATKIIRELREEGFCVTDDMLSRIYAPAGLDIGSETPDEIAVAIVAEIQAVLAGHTGTPLRHLDGPIHTPQVDAWAGALQIG